jgi:CHAT domain-containing protein
MPKEYALFDIRIRELSPNNYAVDVRSALGGDASSSFIPPTGNPIYQQLAERLQRLDTDEDALVELGQILFDALFQGKLKDVYTRSQGGLKEGQGLRLRFDIDPALGEITGLPWEFLYDPDQGPLAMLDMAVVRYLSQQAAPSVLAAPLPLKVLVTGAVTPPEPDVQRELAEVRAALADLEQSGHVKITVEEHLTRAILQRRLREGFQIWHFIGHGSQSRDGTSGTLLFEDSTGEAEAVSARELGIFLNRSGVRLILLDACNSAKLTTDPYRTVAPALIRAQVPAVIAMQFTVPQEATRAFAGEFYRALAEGFPIDACVTEGRKAVVGTSGLRNPDWGIPVVYTRAADGKLFELPEAPAKQQASSGSGGININFGDKNSLSEGSSFNVSEVGTIIKGVSEVNTGGQDQDDLRAEEIETLRELIRTTRRRLNQRQLQAAKYGIGADPSITIEIEDLERQLAKLERDLKKLGG